MSTITSKYSVPFNNRKSTVSDNVMTQIIDGGTGYLNIVLPVIPSTDNSVGFKIRVYDSNYTPNSDYTPLFEGHVSGNSSDGFRWRYVSSVQNENFHISRKPTLFCSKIVDENNSNIQYVKSVLIGDSNTEWGYKLTVVIEYLSATLKTTPDGEGSDSKIERTSDISEFSRLASKSVIDEKDTWSEGWRFYVSSIKPDDSEIDATIDPLEVRDGGNIEINGVVYGVSISEDGKIKITTKFTDNKINLGSGTITADGSKLTNLIGDPDNPSSGNQELKTWVPKLAGRWSSPITLKSNTSSDINLQFSFDGSKDVTSDVSIRKFDVGSWILANKGRFIKPKSTSDLRTLSNSDLTLATGEIGTLVSTNTELFVGNNGINKLIGKIDIVTGSGAIPNLYEIDGKPILHNGTLKVYSEADLEWKSLEIDGSTLPISLDTIKDGSSYKKVNSESITNNYVNKLFVSAGKTLEGSTIYNHIGNSSIHVTQSDKDKWNKVPTDAYSKSEINTLLLDKSNTSHYHSHHNNVSIILETLPATHSYAAGTRVLIKTPTPVIKVSNGPNSWKYDEVFSEGDVVTSLVTGSDKYKEWIFRNGKVEINNDPTLVTSTQLTNKLSNYITLDNTNTRLIATGWTLSNSNGDSIIATGNDSVTLGAGVTNINLGCHDRPTWGGYQIALVSDVTNMEGNFASIDHYHRNHEPVINIVSTIPSSPGNGDRYIVGTTIKEWKDDKWLDEQPLINDTVYNANDDCMYKYKGGTWNKTLRMYNSGTGITIDPSTNSINHSNSLAARTGLLYVTHDTNGHISLSRTAIGDDIPNLDASKITSGILDSERLPDASIIIDSDTSDKIYEKGVIIVGKGLSLEVTESTVGDPGDTELVAEYNNKLTVDYIPSYNKYRGITREVIDGETSYKLSSTEIAILGTPNNPTVGDGFRYNVVSGNSTGFAGLAGKTNIDMLQFSNKYDSKINALFIERSNSRLYLATSATNKSTWDTFKNISINIIVKPTAPTSTDLNGMFDGDYYIHSNVAHS